MNDDQPGQTSGTENPRGNARNPFTELPDKILELLRASPAAELEHHVKAVVSQAADKMDLVPREEFEVQRAMVERLRARVEALEQQLDSQSSS